MQWRGFPSIFGEKTEWAAEYDAAKRANTEEYQKAVHLGRARTLQGGLMGKLGLGNLWKPKHPSPFVLARRYLAIQMQAAASDPGDQTLRLAQHAAAVCITVGDTLSMICDITQTYVSD